MYYSMIHTFTFIFGILVLQYVIRTVLFNRKYRFPNPVPGWPIVGNFFDVPYPSGMWAVGLRDRHGEMFTVRLGGKRQVYLNSSRTVTDLLEKRAAIYSSRPWRPMLNDIMSGGARIIFMPYSDRWRNQRKIMHSILNARQAEAKFLPFQELEAKQLALDLLHDPADFHRATQRFANSVVLSVIFGRRARADDALLQFILSYTTVLGSYQSDPLANPADMFTWLFRLPRFLQWWRSFGLDFHRKHIEMYGKELDMINEKMAKGTAKPCFAVDLIQGANRKEFEISDVEKIYTYSSLIEAGSDTSRVVVLQVLAGAACYPEWVQRARAALDSICGANAERLPSLADRPNLPYITAVVKEALRWRPFIQTGVPHTLMQDDEYEGFKFPAGTEFTWNAYAMALDDAETKDAKTFSPDRHLNADLHAPAKGHWSYGAGRRSCVGLNVGNNNVWISAATILYCFDVTEDPAFPIDKYNSVWDRPDIPPFKVKLIPRSRAHVELIEREGAEALTAEY